MTKILSKKCCDIKIHYPPLDDHAYSILFKRIYGELLQKLSEDEFVLFNTDYNHIEVYYNDLCFTSVSTIVNVLENLTKVPYGVTDVTIDVKYLVVSDLITVLIKS